MVALLGGTAAGAVLAVVAEQLRRRRWLRSAVRLKTVPLAGRFDHRLSKRQPLHPRRCPRQNAVHNGDRRNVFRSYVHSHRATRFAPSSTSGRCGPPDVQPQPGRAPTPKRTQIRCQDFNSPQLPSVPPRPSIGLTSRLVNCSGKAKTAQHPQDRVVHRQRSVELPHYWF